MRVMFVAITLERLVQFLVNTFVYQVQNGCPGPQGATYCKTICPERDSKSL